VSRNYNFRDDKFLELSQAIGALALVWNDLGVALSSLFHAATKIPNRLATDAVWNSIKSDRAQREMINALIKLEVLGYNLDSRLRTEVLWCLKKIENLEDLRNNAVHSPVLFTDEGVVAWHHLGNPRAKGLANKDLVHEFNWFYDSAVVLRQYCEYLTDCVHFARKVDIERPALPNRGRRSDLREKKGK
jgi:hypothetical protein